MEREAIHQQWVVGLMAVAVLLRCVVPQPSDDFDFDRPATPIELKVDLNQADVATIALLPKISYSQAERIVELRQSHRILRSLSDLTNIRGIGPKTVYNIQPMVLALDASKSLP